jgi:RNA polymerase sigma-70 factor (ECF subfamily)
MQREPTGTLQSLALNFCQDKNERNFAKLYNRIKPGLVQYATRIVTDEEAAFDIVADASMKMWQKVDQYNPYWNFSTWAYRIVYNECMQWIRKTKNERPLFDNYDFTGTEGFEASEPDWNLEENPEELEQKQHEALYKATLEGIHSLPDGLYRNIMIDRELKGLKYDDISSKYGININSVKTRISRARGMVQKKVASAGLDTSTVKPRIKKRKISNNNDETIIDDTQGA